MVIILFGAIPDKFIVIKKYMPLKKGKKNVGANIRELMEDNKKKGKVVVLVGSHEVENKY